MDYWALGRPSPPDTAPPAPGTPLFRYLVRRLIDSWDLPKGPLTYLALMNPLYPDASKYVGPVKVQGRAGRTLAKEWPAVQASLDAGRPCPLGLVKVVSANPLDVGKNHQVLAYRYELSGPSLRLGVYDPNQAGRDDVVIALEVADPTQPMSLTMVPDASAVSGVRCFFKVPYTPKAPPPLDG
jgi:hypothetical protein